MGMPRIGLPFTSDKAYCTLLPVVPAVTTEGTGLACVNWLPVTWNAAVLVSAPLVAVTVTVRLE